MQNFEFIIVDIETTGLDLFQSEVIEIGAIHILDGKVIDTFSKLIKPTQRIPIEITKLTGISDNMVKDGTEPRVAAKELKKFIAGLPVIAHNGLDFDFQFLKTIGCEILDGYDSMEFTFFVHPVMASYRVSDLAKSYHLGAEKHRALEDCLLEYEIIKHLASDFLSIPKKVRLHLKYLASLSRWWWDNFLVSEHSSFNSFIDIAEPHKLYRKKSVDQEALEIVTTKLEKNEVEKYFLPETNISTDYCEDRPDQRKMSVEIAESFNSKIHAVIEAGTGIGKSKGYLVPSALFAIKNSIPVVVSTYTKVLQDQLFTKEIPHIKALIKPDLQVALIKGKQNYVCLSKADEIFHDVWGHTFDQKKNYSTTKEGAKYDRPLSFLLLAPWLMQTKRGDWDEIPYWLQQRIPKSIEDDLCNKDETCAKGICDGFDQNKCFLPKAKLRAKDADIVVINHAVFLTGITKTEITPEDGDEDSEIKYRYSHAVLPNESKYIIIDESHRLEDAATSSFGIDISNNSLHFLYDLIYGRRGVTKGLRYSIDNATESQKDLEKYYNDFISQNEKISLLLGIFNDEGLASFVGEQNNQYSVKKIIDSEARTTQSWVNLKQNLEQLAESLTIVAKALKNIANCMGGLNSGDKNIRKLDTRTVLTMRFVDNITEFLAEDGFYVRYLNLYNREVSFIADPISVAGALKDSVYDNFHSVCLVSATLRVGDNFNFVAERCGLDLVDKAKIKYCTFGSAFDYGKQMKFLIPRDITYSADNPDKFFEKMLPFLQDAIIASGGGSLILCSSHEHVDRIYTYLEQPLRNHNISLYRQNRQQSVNSVVRNFKEDLNSVLVGTSSLWQGVDVPGESLRCLFIIKIPYKNPTEPIVVARRDEAEKRGRNGFYDYYQPLAGIELRQGIGRLIRKTTDRGVVVLFDDRLLQNPQLRSCIPTNVEPTRLNPSDICTQLADNNPQNMGEVEDGAELYVKNKEVRVKEVRGRSPARYSFSGKEERD